MNDAFVADSSVGVAWAIPAQSNQQVTELLEMVASGRQFVVPVLWTFEVANALLMLRRRERITTEICTRAQRALNFLAPVVDEEGGRLALTQVFRIAEEYNLTVYDATYLELAVRLGLPLATRDIALRRAAKRSGVSSLLG